MRNLVHLSLCVFLIVAVLPLYTSTAAVNLALHSDLGSGSGVVSATASSGVLAGPGPAVQYPSIKAILIILSQKCQQYMDMGVNPLPSFCNIRPSQESRDVPTVHRLYDRYLREEEARRIETTNRASLRDENPHFS